LDDGIALEALGIPTATVVTVAFVPEARAKAEVLGLPEFSPVVVTHPTVGVPEAELAKRAEEAIPQIVSVLTGQGSVGTGG
jgi:hypothetical protein